MIEWTNKLISKKSRWGNGLVLSRDKIRPCPEICSICSAFCLESLLGLSPWWPASCLARPTSTGHRSSSWRRPKTWFSVFQDPSYRFLGPTLVHSGYRSSPISTHTAASLMLVFLCLRCFRILSFAGNRQILFFIFRLQTSTISLSLPVWDDVWAPQSRVGSTLHSRNSFLLPSFEICPIR